MAAAIALDTSGRDSRNTVAICCSAASLAVNAVHEPDFELPEQTRGLAEQPLRHLRIGIEDDQLRQVRQPRVGEIRRADRIAGSGDHTLGRLVDAQVEGGKAVEGGVAGHHRISCWVALAPCGVVAVIRSCRTLPLANSRLQKRTHGVAPRRRELPAGRAQSSSSSGAAVSTSRNSDSASCEIDVGKIAQQFAFRSSVHQGGEYVSDSRRRRCVGSSDRTVVASVANRARATAGSSDV